jgi:hypothetical protein
MIHASSWLLSEAKICWCRDGVVICANFVASRDYAVKAPGAVAAPWQQQRHKNATTAPLQCWHRDDVTMAM